MGDKRDDLVRFYAILDRLERHIGGARRLANCSGRLTWPHRGVYFFREGSENAVQHGLRSKDLPGRNARPQGRFRYSALDAPVAAQGPAGDGRRQSPRLHLPSDCGRRTCGPQGRRFPTCGSGNTAGGEIRKGEFPLEQEVSRFIGTMPFLWLALEDDAGPASPRGYVERNAIALLSVDGLAAHCSRQGGILILGVAGGRSRDERTIDSAR